MSRYVQIRAFKAYIRPTAIHRVLAACIEQNVTEFTVADDRGGSDHWMVCFPPGTLRKTVREIVGPGVQIEED